MGLEVRKNERSWAIDLISKINSIVASNDLTIKKAGGESTVSTGRQNMFPDVILYSDVQQTTILQGWELKMPDVPIEDSAFIADAQRKARVLGLNSCLIWNFTYVVLYKKNDDETFSPLKQWSDTSFIKTREDVKTYRKEWEDLLEKVIYEVNTFFTNGTFHRCKIEDVISQSTITTLVERNKPLIAEELKKNSVRNTIIEATINNWWSDIKSEYEKDETDPFSAYAKTIVLNWANRILFAHLIKEKQKNAQLINTLDYETTPEEANQLFKNITSKCDFFNVFNEIEFNTLLPSYTWEDLVEFSNFLQNAEFDNLDQTMLQNILEGSVKTSKREIHGQYTTPPELAKILVRMSIKDYSKHFLDCCCGTGTIPKAVLELKKEKIDTRTALDTVWASDKHQYPLQIANISMANADTIFIPNKIFQHNALSLQTGESISIVDPASGENLTFQLPKMGTIASNLPFVEFEKLSEDDKAWIATLGLNSSLDSRADLYCYIAVKLASLLEENGTAGIITSNSWLGTEAGVKFRKTLEEHFSIKQIHISGKGRWFQNADVVTTIMILDKHRVANHPTSFFLWKKSLQEYASNTESEEKLINSALLERELDKDVVVKSTYTQDEIEELLYFNISYNALFHNVSWLKNFKSKTLKLDTVFNVIRGSRRGWDAMFYPQAGTHNIEKRYLKPVLLNARSVTSLTATPDSDAFVCEETEEYLRENNENGAFEWIQRFKHQVNKVGKPLPEVLAKSGMHWYELQCNEMAELFTMMNPDKRLFFGRFKDSSAFVNQRLIGLNHRSDFPDIEINHALVNSLFTMFCIEASGFGRGLGVLDINKDNIAKCFMFDPRQLNQTQRENILSKFNVLMSREIKNVLDEVTSEDRLAFEKAVFSTYGLESQLQNVIDSLVSMQKTRASVKD